MIEIFFPSRLAEQPLVKPNKDDWATFDQWTLAFPDATFIWLGSRLTIHAFED